MSNIKYELLIKQIERQEEKRKNPQYIDMEKLKREKEEYHRTHPDIKPDS